MPLFEKLPENSPKLVLILANSILVIYNNNVLFGALHLLLNHSLSRFSLGFA